MVAVGMRTDTLHVAAGARAALQAHAGLRLSARRHSGARRPQLLKRLTSGSARIENGADVRCHGRRIFEHAEKTGTTREAADKPIYDYGISR